MMISQYSILIVEDEYIAAEYLTRILRTLGVITLYKASSAKEALISINEYDIDLVFMDINIKGSIDGIECAGLLNEQHAIPILHYRLWRYQNHQRSQREKYLWLPRKTLST